MKIHTTKRKMNSTVIVIFLISVGFSEQGPRGDKFDTWLNQGRGS